MILHPVDCHYSKSLLLPLFLHMDEKHFPDRFCQQFFTPLYSTDNMYEQIDRRTVHDYEFMILFWWLIDSICTAS